MTRNTVVVAGTGIALAIAALLLPEFHVTVLNYIGLYSLVTLGLVLLTGVAGLTSFGQAAFVGIGAYTTAVLTTTYGLPPWIGLAAGLAVTATAAVLIGAVTTRLSGHYLPLSTLAWGISLFFVFGNFEALGGHTGIASIPPLAIFGYALDTPLRFFYLMWAIVLVSVVLLTRLLDSRQGRAIRALKGGASLAESFGINPPYIKMIAFVIAALLAAVSGWLYAHLLRFVNPTPFGLNIGIEYLFMAVIGGVGYIWGAVVGAAVFTVLKQVLQDILPALLGKSGNFEAIVLGIIMILLLQHAREGIVGLLARLVPRTHRPPVPPDTPSLAHRTQVHGGDVVLKVEALTKRFGGLTAVNDISFEIRAGEILGLIGPNGAGKSTVFNLITGVLSPTSGEVRVLGERVDTKSARDIARRGVARTFQHVHLLPEMSVLENVMIGAHIRGRKGVIAGCLRLDSVEEASIQKEATRALGRVGLEKLLDEQAGNLALGQQRTLEIARALAADPQLLLLDEPAAGLRHHEKVQLSNLLNELRDEGLTILLVEHDMEFVMNLVDRLVVMEFGQKLAQGGPDQILADPRVLEAYLGGVE